MTKSRPVFTVVPGTGDDEDVNAANLGEQVMRYLWDRLNAMQITTKALLWSRICGAAFVKVYWDSTVGESTEVLVSSSDQILKDGNGAPIYAGTEQAQTAMQTAAQMGQPPESIRVKRIARGEIQLEACSPFQMFVDPLADTFDDAEWVIQESVKSREHVRRRYDVDLTPDTPANPGLVEVKMGSFIPGSSPYKGIKLREYWAKPSSKFPTGRRVVWAQGKILDEDDAPFDPCPYVMFSSIPIPGRLWPTSIVEQLRGPQTELNKVKSQMAENRNRLGNPTLLASKQAVQDPEKFADSTSTPGGIYYYDDVGSPNAVPKYLEAPPLPEYVVDEIQRIEESIQEISGQHEVTSAQVPPGVTAASAINLLQEADDTRLGPGVFDYELQLSKLGEKALALVGNFYTDQRTIRISGDNGDWQIRDFRGAMLKGNTHVQVQTGSAFPQSKAAKQAALMDILRMLAQMGHQFSPQDLAQFLQDYEIGGAARLIDQYTKNETQINRENLQLSQGAALPINDYDDDQTHVEGHSDFQKSQRYQELSPEIKRIFELHVAAHRERLSQQQQQTLQMQMQMEGKVPPNMTAASLQAQHELSQLQGQQQLDIQGAQAQQQQTGQAQQQGFDAAAGEQKQRQAEELHAQKMQHAQETHESNLQRQREQHEANLQRIQAQARQRPQQPRKAA